MLVIVSIRISSRLVPFRVWVQLPGPLFSFYGNWPHYFVFISYCYNRYIYIYNIPLVPCRATWNFMISSDLNLFNFYLYSVIKMTIQLGRKEAKLYTVNGIIQRKQFSICFIDTINLSYNHVKNFLLNQPFPEDDNYVETGRIHFCNVVYFVNRLLSINMSFFQQAYEFRKLFRDIEKLTMKCVHLKCGIEYIYIYAY